MHAAIILRLAIRLLPHVLSSPFFAAYGALVLAGALFRLLLRVLRLRHVARDAITCPFGHAVPVAGRYACASCRASYVGWIGRCTVCGDGADMTSCPECGVGVRLPWEDRA